MKTESFATQRYPARSRGSAAKICGLLLPGLCLTLFNASAQVNILNDPGFESGGTVWSATIVRGATGSAINDPGKAHSGNYYFQTTGNSGWSSVMQGDSSGSYSTGASLPIVATDFYQLSAWVQVPGAAANPQPIVLRYRFNPSANRADVGLQTISTENWTQLQSAWIQPAALGGTADTLLDYFEVHSDNNNIMMNVDDCALLHSAPLALTGRVVDSTGAGVDGATISATSTGWTPASTTTSGGGYYTLNVPPGTYTVAAAKALYSSASASATLSSGGVAAPNITLTALPTTLVSGQVFKLVNGSTVGVSGVVVSANYSSGPPSVSAPSSANGSYSVTVLVGAQVTLSASATSVIQVATPTPFAAPSTTPVTGVNIQVSDIPSTGDLLFSLDTGSLPVSGATGNWLTLNPSGLPFVSLAGTPTVQQFGGVTWEQNDAASGTRFRLEDPSIAGGSYSSPVALSSGATVVLAVKPTRNATGTAWNTVVDVFFNQLSVGIHNESGLISVGVNDTGNTVTTLPSNTAIPSGQITIISLVVQNSGEFLVYTNGTPIYTNTATWLSSGAYTQLTPGTQGTYANYIDIGGEDPDAWAAYNGYIGDVFVYTAALTDADRQSLEASLKAKFITNATLSYTITTTAGANGSISPSGAVSVVQGYDQTFTLTANDGYVVSDLLVDGVSVGAKAAYTFSNVATNHSIAATFAALPPQTITASADGTNGTITPSGDVIVAAGANQKFTIVPNSGYAVSEVVVDGVSQGEIYGYTFPFVIATHTISVTFRALDLAVPRADQLIFSAVGNALPGDDSLISSWPTYVPAGQKLTAVGGSPTSVKGVAGVTGTNIWENNVNTSGDGLRYTGAGGTNATYTSPIPCSGATIIAVAAPSAIQTSVAWNSLVSVFYNQLALDIRNESGAIQVQLNGVLSAEGAAIPSQQPTILSLVVQPDGSYTVYANGASSLSGSGSALTNLVPGIAGSYADFIEIGRDGVDGWSSYSGNIGDVFLYKAALTNADRVTLETALGAKYGISIPNILFSGKVTLQDGVTPVAGVLVTATGPNGAFTATTAADGTYSLYLVKGDSYSVTVTGPSDVQVGSNFTIVASTASVHNFQMSPINTIQGAVKNAGGTPIPNAIVQIGVDGPAATTDTDGKYSIVITPGTDVSFYADALGYTNDTETIDTSAAATGLLTKNVVLSAQDESDYTYIQNGSFENGMLAPWFNDGTGPVVGVTNTIHSSGSYAGYWESKDSGWYEGYIEQDIPVIADSTYNIYYKVKASSPGLTGQTGFNFVDANGNSLAWWGYDEGVWTSANGNGWMCYLDGAWDQVLNYRSSDYALQAVGVRLTPPDGTVFIQILVGLGPTAAGQSIYLDDVVVDRVGPSAPVLLPAITLPGGVPTFTIQTLANHSYRLIYKDSLSDASWTALGTATPGTGSAITLTDTTASPTTAHRFYRIQLN